MVGTALGTGCSEQGRRGQLATRTSIHVDDNTDGPQTASHHSAIGSSLQGADIVMAEGKSGWDGDKQTHK